MIFTAGLKFRLASERSRSRGSFCQAVSFAVVELEIEIEVNQCPDGDGT